MELSVVRQAVIGVVSDVLGVKEAEVEAAGSLVDDLDMDEFDKLDVLNTLVNEFDSKYRVDLDDEGIYGLSRLDDFVWLTVEGIIPKVDGTILTEEQIARMVVETVVSCSKNKKIKVEPSSPLKELRMFGVDFNQVYVDLSDRFRPYFTYPQRELMRKWHVLKDLIDFTTSCWRRKMAGGE